MSTSRTSPRAVAHIAIGTLVFMLAASAAQVSEIVTEPLNTDRYHVAEIEGGLLRIDRQTVEISECGETENGWICRLAADDRLAYEAEINRLDAELTRAREEVASLSSQLEERVSPLAPDTSEAGELSARERMDLPSDDEVDAFMDSAEHMMRRFFDMVEDIRRDNEAERGL